MDVSNARFQSDVYNSFIANCRAAQQSDIFYHAVRRLHGTVSVSASMLLLSDSLGPCNCAVPADVRFPPEGADG
jgi:hypothetical protein